MKTRKVIDIPKYERVKRLLIRDIESGSRSPGEPFPSERQLLRQFGVSRPTLVRSLQELVREGYLIRRQGKGTFVAPRHSEATENGNGHSFVVFLSRYVADMTGAGREVHLRILRGVQDAMGDAYDASVVRQVASDFIDADTRRLADSRANGSALIIEPSFCPSLRHYLTERGWCVWSVNEPVADANCVYIDQERAGYLATRYLLDQGHQRVALLNGPEDTYWGFRARGRGYTRALQEAEFEIDERLMLEGAHAIDSESGRAMMRKLLDSGIAFDSVVGASDSKAIGAMACAAERGKRIPEDIAFVSIDNTLACRAEFPLPAVAMPFEEMGFQAALQASRTPVGRADRYTRSQMEVIIRPNMVER